MKQPQSRQEVQAKLQDKQTAIVRRIDALEDEVSSTGASMKRALLENPYISIGVTVAAGLAVGWLLGGVGRRNKSAARHTDLLEAYFDLVAADASRAVQQGHAPAEAIREALKARAPIVVTPPPPSAPSPGIFRSLLGMATRVTVSIGLQNLMAGLVTPRAPAEGAAEAGGSGEIVSGGLEAP